MNIGVAGLTKSAPPDWVELQQKRAEINNLPPIGHDSNRGFFSQLQVNLAGVQDFGSTVSLEGDLGRAGKAHYDCHDYPQGFTCMFCMSNFDSSSVHPGLFFFLELRIYIKMENYQLVYFSGLHFHGGSPPTSMSPNSLSDEDLARARVVAVLYPNDTLHSGFLPGVAWVGPGGGKVEVVPNQAYDVNADSVVQQGPLNYARDGTSIMSDDAYLQFLPRHACNIIYAIAKQSPLLDIDMDMLSKLLKDKRTGQTVDYMKDWKYPPTMSTSALVEARSVAQQVEENKLKISMSIPTQVKRLYNTGALNVEADDLGSRSLQINVQKLNHPKKKRKSESIPSAFWTLTDGLQPWQELLGKPLNLRQRGTKELLVPRM